MATQQAALLRVDLTVTNGPSFWEVVLALFDRKETEFTIETFGIGRIKARITAVSRRKDGTWGIGGEIFQTDSWNLAHDCHPFKGFYDPRTRTGRFSAKAIVKGEPGFLTNSLVLLLRDGSSGGERFRRQLEDTLGIPVKNGIRDVSNWPGFVEQ